ncbi:MAG TPA: response regulator transcription factor [Kofleriaceae bacterium]|nr:response regulator transcription factor [Kofleriaceae bacterium]
MTQPSPRILVVDDEVHIRDVIHYALAREGFAVDLAADAEEALGVLSLDHALVVLDVLMPGQGGLSFCRQVRATSAIPIIFVSSRAEEADRLVGLELGGDDYLVKPFSPRELVARIRSVLRRAAPAPPREPERVTFGPLAVDARRRQAVVGHQTLELTATELSLLFHLLAAGGRALTRAELIASTHGGPVHMTERTIDTHVRRIRAKLRRFGLAPIETVHGIGYRAAQPP